MQRQKYFVMLFLLYAAGCRGFQYPSVVAVDSDSGEVLEKATVDREITAWLPGVPSPIPARIAMVSKKFDADAKGVIAIADDPSSDRLSVNCKGYYRRNINCSLFERMNPLRLVQLPNQPYLDGNQLVVPLKSKWIKTTREKAADHLP